MQHNDNLTILVKMVSLSSLSSQELHQHLSFNFEEKLHQKANYNQVTFGMHEIRKKN